MAHEQQTLNFLDIQQLCCTAPSRLQHQFIKQLMTHEQQTLNFLDIQLPCCTAPSWLQHQLIRLIMADAQQTSDFSKSGSTAAQHHHGCTIRLLENDWRMHSRH
jgi:hypothetical protein